MQQIVASRWLLNIFSLVYWSENPRPSPRARVLSADVSNQDKYQTKVANHTDIADIIVNSACFQGGFLIF